MTTVTFAIGGMHCAACAVRNERTLLKTPGVREANVNLGTRRARVEFDETAVSEAALREAVVGNGYEVLDDDASAVARHFTKHSQDLEAVRRVEIAGRLVAQDGVGLDDEGPGNRYANRRAEEKSDGREIHQPGRIHSKGP